ncbi:peptidyl-tRNA hydrolase, mitochondrial-like isoform X3 [Malus domestica]|uniref:peptidyl-tRNA hydrolase, mitochondrial-like isoform X3 n=1 Tax=Malus domestica TaxID=3750 RepID=UPI003974DD50
MIDAFAGSQGIALNTVQCKAILGQGFVGEVLVFLAKPQIEMNLRDRTPLLLIISSLSIVCLCFMMICPHRVGYFVFTQMEVM